MKLCIETDRRDRDTIDLYVNGTLQAQISVGVCDTRDTLQAQVAAAHARRALVWHVQQLPTEVAALTTIADHVHKKPEQREAAYLRGLVAGLQDATVPHPTEALLPGLPPEHTCSFRHGWTMGQAMRGALAVQEGAEAVGELLGEDINGDGHTTAQDGPG
jgi:hypothetical protein